MLINLSSYYFVRSISLSDLLLVQAIRMFARARPPGIYKLHYIEDLYKFYHEPKPQSLVCPSTPEWKRPETPDLNRVATTDQDEDDEDDFMAALQVRIIFTHSDLLDLLFSLTQ